MSTRFTLDKKDGLNIGKVFLWTALSGMITSIIVLLGALPPEIQEVVSQYWWFPSVAGFLNTALVALKKFIENKLEE